MSTITHLRSVRITAPDPADLLTFYEQVWGLTRVAAADADDDGAVHLRATGPEQHVVTIAPGEGRALELISLGASSRGAVDDLAERLRAAGATIVAPPAERDGPGGGYAVRFLDPEGRTLEVSADVAAHDAHDAIGGPGPARLSHVVLNAPDLPASRAFYTELLGFKVSDWYEDDLMVFLRCNEQHHCIVLTPNPHVSLNHVAFEVGDTDAVMRALGRLRKAGFESIWGPGRHGPGGNVFCYFTDPAGNVIEYTAELIEVDDATWLPQEWARSPENADVWGTSGGITPAVREAMINAPTAT